MLLSNIKLYNVTKHPSKKSVTFGYSVFVWKYGNSSRDGWW